MPKAAPIPFEVEVDGGESVQCTIKDGLVNVGLNSGWPSSLRFPVKVSKTADLEQIKEKVSAHAKFAACRAQAGGAATSSTFAAAAPLQREMKALAVPEPASSSTQTASVPQLMVRRGRCSMAEQIFWDTANPESTATPLQTAVPVESLPYLWFKPAIRRGDGSILVAADAFVRLPNHRHVPRFFEHRCFSGNSILK